MEEATQNTLQQVNSTFPISQVHYTSYENNKKSKKKPPSTKQNSNSKKLCYRCGEHYSKEHEPVYRAQNAFCNGCGKKGHFQIVCKTTGKFPQKQKPDSTDISEPPTATQVQPPTGFLSLHLKHLIAS